AAGLWQFIPSTGKLYGLNQNWWYDGRRDVVAATEAALDHLKELAEQFDGDWELALAAYNAGAGGVGRAIKKNQKKNKPTDYWNLSLPRETRIYVPRLLALVKIFAEPERYGVELIKIPNQPYFASIDTESQLDLTMAADLADISLDELYQLNPGFNRWATAPNGPHRLNVPVAKAEQFETKLASLAPEERLKWTRYKIKKGDNLGAIAKKFGTTVALLKQTNKLSSSRIRAGKHLLIPTSTRSLSQPALPPTAKNKQIIHHTIRAGDSLWAIGKQYKVSHKEIAGWNNLSINSTLRLGQKLIIKKSVSGMLTARAKAGKSFINYRVRKGDSLFSIAERFNVSVANLRKWNSFSSKYLQPGQKISLYVDVTEQSL
ncbi:MAG: LysM peptidoglycan-binding domain-containing protein, partial [Chromatiales bacterium]|nr:LysM peptidoglycan-binding domain-containing protein [Chromatiales bacterium]